MRSSFVTKRSLQNQISCSRPWCQQYNIQSPFVVRSCLKLTLRDKACVSRPLSSRSVTMKKNLMPNFLTKRNLSSEVKIERVSATISNSSASSVKSAFNRSMKQLQKNGAARAHQRYNPPPTNEIIDAPESYDYDYFRREIAARLIDRLDDIKKEGGFPLALDVGSGPGFLHHAICADEALQGEGGIGGIRRLVEVESSETLLHRDEHIPVDGSERCGVYRMVAEEEGKLNFPDGTFDLVLSSCSLHWINDLPNLFKEVSRVLKPDGCFIFAMVGGKDTLSELRSSLVLAEMERDGGVSSHVGPFVDISDLGSLLTAAGFKLPTIDVDTLQFAYPDAMVVMEHLQRMGEGNVNLNRRERISVDTFLASAAIYDEMFGLDDDLKQSPEDEQAVPVTIQIIYAIGWTPHESQPNPLQRGSATNKITELSKAAAPLDVHDSRQPQ